MNVNDWQKLTLSIWDLWLGGNELLNSWAFAINYNNKDPELYKLYKNGNYYVVCLTNGKYFIKTERVLVNEKNNICINSPIYIN